MMKEGLILRALAISFHEVDHTFTMELYRILPSLSQSQ